jgi:hypothetical protein
MAVWLVVFVAVYRYWAAAAWLMWAGSLEPGAGLGRGMG